MASRQYDLVVFGATGFTGKLCVEYLQSGAGAGTKWAIAGRSKVKLNEVLADTGAAVPIEVADSSDEDALRALVKRTKVVLTTVGPYVMYGELLLKVCAEEGTHYLDLTGESFWVASMISKYERSALSSKAMIITSSGFDSIPSDLNTFYAVQKLQKVAGPNNVGKVSSFVQFKGGMSGGTVASIVEALGQISNPERRIGVYGTSPIKGKSKVTMMHYSDTFRGRAFHGGYWLMERCNLGNVSRTWGLLQTSQLEGIPAPYGASFTYSEVAKTGSKLGAIISSSIWLFSFSLLIFVPPLRRVLAYFLPPGTGPSRKTQENGFFRLTTIAKSADAKHEVCTRMTGKGDPGYAATSKLIVNASLVCVHDFEKLGPFAKAGGFLTPATALGHTLIDRLSNSGWFKFEQVEDAKTK